MKKEGYKIIGYFLLVTIPIYIIGCSREPQRTISKNDKNTVKMGYIFQTSDNKNIIKALNTIENFTKNYNAEIIATTGNTNTSILKNIDYLSTKDVKGIIISAVNAKLGPAILARSKRLGIKIISIQNNLVDANGTYIRDIPHVGVSIKTTSLLISNTILKIIKEKNWNTSNTAILLLKENNDSSFETCIKLIDNTLRKKNIPSGSIISENPIPSPDGIIVSPKNTAKIKKHKYKNIVIYGFKRNKLINLLKIFKNAYNYQTNNVIGFSTTYSTNFNNHTLPPNYYGSIFINQKQYGYKTTELLYKWILNNEIPPTNVIIPVKLIKNPNSKIN
jgi:simple sugar transport system substrate-binding protein